MHMKIAAQDLYKLRVFTTCALYICFIQNLLKYSTKAPQIKRTDNFNLNKEVLYTILIPETS